MTGFGGCRNWSEVLFVLKPPTKKRAVFLLPSFSFEALFEN